MERNGGRGDAPADAAAPPTPEIGSMLADHRQWLSTGAKAGRRADLVGQSLPGADFKRADLRKADLRRADLRAACLDGADLTGADAADANFRMATLRGARLGGADLRRARFRDADLSNVQMTEAMGLLVRNLGGADLSNAALPADVAGFDGLQYVSEVAQNARRIFQAMLGGSVYCWLTIAVTTDANLLTNSASSPLPIIQTEVPIAGFFWVAPLILLCAYFWLHLYMQRLWESLADLPAVFPDGKALPEKAYPWLPMGLVFAYFGRFADRRPPLSKVQNAVSVALLWWIVPFTLAWFWARYLPRHDWPGTLYLVLLLSAAVGFGAWSFALARRTLRGEASSAFRWMRPWADWRFGRIAGAAAIGASFAFLSFSAIEGPERAEAEDISDKERAILLFADALGLRTYADLEEVNLAGAKLRGRDLRFARANSVVLTNADLRAVRMHSASLALAKLDGANLQSANFRGAWLPAASLRQADLSHVKFNKADLSLVNLEEANLLDVDMSETSLFKANFRRVKRVNGPFYGAHMTDVNLEDADFSYAYGLTAEQLEDACGNENTRLPDDLEGFVLKACR